MSSNVQTVQVRDKEPTTLFWTLFLCSFQHCGGLSTEYNVCWSSLAWGLSCIYKTVYIHFVCVCVCVCVCVIHLNTHTHMRPHARCFPTRWIRFRSTWMKRQQAAINHERSPCKLACSTSQPSANLLSSCMDSSIITVWLGCVCGDMLTT